MQFLTSSQFCLFLNNKIEIYGNTDHVMGVKLHSISNNLKGLQNSLKRVKTFEYSKKNNLDCNGLRENHSLLADEKKWADELKGPIFFHVVQVNLSFWSSNSIYRK